jgi:hypothetical protein
VITLTTGQKIMVLESATDVVDRVVAFRRSILNGGVASPILSRDQQEGASLESEPG